MLNLCFCVSPYQATYYGERVEARSVRGLAHMVFAAHSTPARRLEKLFYDLLSLICHNSVVCPHEMIIGSEAVENTSLS